MNKRHFIGIGSQRAGSTLLSKLLDASSNVTMHPLKELHYFDTLYGYRSSEVLAEFSARQINREIEKIVAADNYSFINKRYRCYLRTNKLLSAGKIDNIDYLDLFRPLVAGAEILGEITPEYMLFNEEHVLKMRGVIGVDASVVLIARNPVKRILSALKLMIQYNGVAMNQAQASQWLRNALGGSDHWMINQDKYNNYEEVALLFSRSFEHFSFVSYDDLVTSPLDTAEKISREVGIEIDSEKFSSGVGKVVNNLGPDVLVDSDVVEALERRYEYVNDYLSRVFASPLVA